MKRKHLVRYFKPILNWILGRIYIFLLLALIGVIVYALSFSKPLIELLKNEDNTLSGLQENVLAGLIVALASALAAGILKFAKKILASTRKIKRKLYNLCCSLHKGKYTPRVLKKIISYFVNLFYFHNRELIKPQQEIVDNILTSLDNNSFHSKSVYWILGNSYSGKTTTVLNLLLDLISKEVYQELFQKLDGHIVYFDLGKTGDCLKDLQHGNCLEKFSRCLIILDNLHKLSGNQCFSILNRMVAGNHSFALIVLLRHPEEFFSENDKVDKLNEIISDNGTSYNLKSLESNSFAICPDKQLDVFCERFFPLNQVFENSRIQIHLYMLYLKKECDTFKIIPKIQAFLGHNNESSCSINLELVTIISNSLFTGSFNLSLVEECIPWTSELKCKKLLNALTQIGFLTHYPNSRNDFYFHEEIAKIYFKETFEKKKDIYVRIFQQLAHNSSSCNNPVLKFLYCMLAREIDCAKKLFEEIVSNVNFLNLYEDMMFLFDLSVCNIDDYYKEIGILCDRCGKLQDAKNFYANYWAKENNADAFYKLVQIDHKIIDKYANIQILAINSDDLYINSLSKYWKIHINMHRGIFQFQSILDLACEVQKHAEDIVFNHPYDGLHLIRRLYFDIFRIYYLEGIFDPEKLHPFTSNTSSMYRILSQKLDEFEAYYIKFAVGLMLGQDVLFTLGFENKGLDLKKYHFIFGDYVHIDSTETCNYRAIANKAICVYEQAIKLFDKIGDKTAIFVKYHMYNIKFLLIEDGDFSECESFYQEYMAFATRENILEYQAYAETFKLKMSLIQLFTPAVISSSCDHQMDELKNTIQQKLELARKYEELANPETGNRYAKLRLDLYEALFTYYTRELSETDFRGKIQHIKEYAQKRGYHRELKIIRYIEEKISTFGLKTEHMRVIFSYYPIVPQ